MSDLSPNCAHRRRLRKVAKPRVLSRAQSDFKGVYDTAW